MLSIRRYVLFVLLLSLLTNFFFAAWLLTRGDNTRTIVLSPKATETHLATQESVSSNLLERFSIEAIHLVMNATPATARHQTERFLQYVAPESYGSFRVLLTQGVADLESHMASTAFYPLQSVVRPEKLEVCLSGERRTMIGKTVTGTDALTVCVTSVVRAGRLWIREMKETKGTNREKGEKS